MNSSTFLLAASAFSMYSIMSSANSDSFTSCFPTWFNFISFSSLINLARISKTMLHKNGESGNPFLVPVLIRNDFSFSTLRLMLSVGLSLWHLLCWYRFSCWPHSGEFFFFFMINRCWILQKIFLYLLRWPYNFILQFVNVVYHTNWFAYFKESLHPWDNSHLIMVYACLLPCLLFLSFAFLGLTHSIWKFSG